ncbi:MAG: hypothetical protein QOH31_5915 [Verrucomicrobiota bacterium]
MAQPRRMGMQTERAQLTQSAEVFALPFWVPFRRQVCLRIYIIVRVLSSQSRCDEISEFEHPAADPSLHCSERLA